MEPPESLGELERISAFDDKVFITGNEPLNAPDFFSVVEKVRARAPSAEIRVETTGLPLLDDTLRRRAAALENVLWIVPLYGKDAETNAALTQNPDHFASMRRLFDSSLRGRLALQTMALKGNIRQMPAFLAWARDEGLPFAKYRMLLSRPTAIERRLYAESAVPYGELVEGYLRHLVSEPVDRFDHSFRALPRCVLAAAGLGEKILPWKPGSTQVSMDVERNYCPHKGCSAYAVCPKVPEVYMERHGFLGIAKL